MNPNEKRKDLGITAKKDEDFGEWFSQVLKKADLIEYTDVSGCYVLKPTLYHMWEEVQSFLDKKFKKIGVKNAYFPLFIPEHLLTKEQEHVKGFVPEVAWVTHSGETELPERLAIRPTSETIMYDAYSKWIQSYRDLPLRINQWCNVVRWEFKHPIPLLRSREFLWQEGHTVFATKKEADKEVRQILDIYEQCYNEMMAVPGTQGRKTDKEKFAGADYTTTFEVFTSNGKVAQACTSHHLGQNFAKSFNITYLDKDGQSKHPFQNSWGFTTRSLGVALTMHSDDKGLVMPPKIAPIKGVIVPILFEDSRDNVMAVALRVEKMLSKYDIFLDDSERTPGFKFNEWELKGIPIRIEIGPKDVEKQHVVLARRDTGAKEFVLLTDLEKRFPVLLDTIQKDMYEKALKFQKDSIIEVDCWDNFLKAAKEKKVVRAPFCGEEICEDNIKNEADGIKSSCIPFDQPDVERACVKCGKPGKLTHFAKSY